MDGFFIQINNKLLDNKHRKRMGSAVWEFMWFLDKITDIDKKKGIGKVLGGKPIKLEEIAKEQGVSVAAVSLNVIKLRERGYINVLRTPYGLVISVNKAQKVFNQKAKKNRAENQENLNQENNVSHQENLMENQGNNVSNIRQDSRQDNRLLEENKFSSEEKSPSPKENTLPIVAPQTPPPPKPMGGMAQKMDFEFSVIRNIDAQNITWENFDVPWFMTRMENLRQYTDNDKVQSKDILSMYALINPDYEDLYANKTERTRQIELLNRYGFDKIKTLIRIIPGFKKKAKQKIGLITKPSQLRKQLPNLIQNITEAQGSLKRFKDYEKSRVENIPQDPEERESFTKNEVYEEIYKQDALRNGTTPEIERAKHQKQQQLMKEALARGEQI